MRTEVRAQGQKFEIRHVDELEFNISLVDDVIRESHSRFLLLQFLIGCFFFHTHLKE